MAEIPDHLLKRAQAAREKAEAQQNVKSEDAPSEKNVAEDDVLEEEIVLTDDHAEAALEILAQELDSKLLHSHIAPGRGLWIRVAIEDWRFAAKVAKESLDCKFFDWLSAIDWMPPPYGREHETEQDKLNEEPEEDTPK